MTIIRKTVTQHGNSGKILMPTRTVGKEAYVFFDDEIDFLKDIIAKSYMYNKLADHDVRKLEKEFALLKEDMIPRLALIERTLASLVKPNSGGIQSSDREKVYRQ